MSTESDYEVVEMMERYGGSFIKALAYAMRCADRLNFARLRTEFDDYWDDYLDMVKTQKKNEKDKIPA